MTTLIEKVRAARENKLEASKQNTLVIYDLIWKIVKNHEKELVEYFTHSDKEYKITLQDGPFRVTEEAEELCRHITNSRISHWNYIFTREGFAITFQSVGTNPHVIRVGIAKN